MDATIMLVDDSAICNLMMKKVLSRLFDNLKIHDFTDPEVAYSELPTINPSLIFLDLNMPELDGWGFLKQMQESGQKNRVIILTSSTSTLDQARCASFSNVIAYHTKPLTQALVNSLMQTFQTESFSAGRLPATP
ncbi:response regulator [Spirosoma utsteinense]|uniref:CheY-like chemotaxis protein n=1 Tax=Spirosoma utsteinense TaxID=2585773 RepID=A0ABR6W291_9BACT|nr:response regulator [Spirosoma utsteinense]MBC3785987.1 CheY-like chemotaxis protein [Spirosoma utsteinense]MBC3790685.1 CheY-like chemotaxis protein [Spirosoma utsteinense]